MTNVPSDKDYVRVYREQTRYNITEEHALLDNGEV